MKGLHSNRDVYVVNFISKTVCKISSYGLLSDDFIIKCVGSCKNRP